MIRALRGHSLIESGFHTLVLQTMLDTDEPHM